MTPICLVPIISETAGDSDLVTMECLSEMGTWESNGHVTLKGQGRDLNMFGPSIPETAGDSDLVTMERL